MILSPIICCSSEFSESKVGELAFELEGSEMGPTVNSKTMLLPKSKLYNLFHFPFKIYKPCSTHFTTFANFSQIIASMHFTQ